MLLVLLLLLLDLLLHHSYSLWRTNCPILMSQ